MMGLEDKFENRSFIEKIDDYFLDVNTKVAKKWQDKTYKSKDDLANYLYLLSGASHFGNYAVKNFQGENAPCFLFSGILSLGLYYFDGCRIKSKLEEEIICNKITYVRNVENLTIYGEVVSEHPKKFPFERKIADQTSAFRQRWRFFGNFF